MPITRPQLISDLNRAYRKAKRHKTRSRNVKDFERNLEENINLLATELTERTYRPSSATCFVISDPKKREIFAADFRDRVVHHLYYDYTHIIFERSFIADSYSCIKGRGTHYGISRLQHHIRSCRQQTGEEPYVLKLDIKGYFMHINRKLLLQLVADRLTKAARQRVSSHSEVRWQDCLDFDFLLWLSGVIILQDPTVGCIMRGKSADWDALPNSKSLFYSQPDCGLPIGNLTSQLFSNVYLSEFDNFMKRRMKCRHYGRYVDDAFVVSHSRQQLNKLISEARSFLFNHLGLVLHEGKTHIVPTRCGVEFLGAFILPDRTYVAGKTLRRITPKILALEQKVKHMPRNEVDVDHLRCSLSSFGGVLGHYDSYCIRLRLFSQLPTVCRYGAFDYNLLKFVPYPF